MKVKFCVSWLVSSQIGFSILELFLFLDKVLQGSFEFSVFLRVAIRVT